MTGLLALHLALEDKVMYPRLVAHRGGEVGDRARGFQAEVGGVREAVAREIQVFLIDLRSRVFLEEKEIYNLPEKVGNHSS